MLPTKKMNLQYLLNDYRQSPRRNPHQKGILFVNHTLGGGTQYYQDDQINRIKSEARVFSLKIKRNMLTLDDLNQVKKMSFSFSAGVLTQESFDSLLSALDIQLIYVNQLVSYPVFRFMDFIQNSGISYIYDIHDFHCVCPSFNLLDGNGKHCFANTEIKKCQACITGRYPFSYINMKAWRERFSSFLENASQIIAPSDDAKNIFLKYYPKLEITVQERCKPDTIQYTFKPNFLKERELNIAFIGTITEHKGSHILYQMLKQIRKRKLPINIKVIGTTDIHKGPFLSRDGKLEVTGRYDNQKISELLAKYQIALIVIPSLWPETYSWTTSEAMWSGYPVITFNLGAPADRVRMNMGGWVVKQMNSGEILNLLVKLEGSRHEILEMANNLQWEVIR